VIGVMSEVGHPPTVGRARWWRSRDEMWDRRSSGVC